MSENDEILELKKLIENIEDDFSIIEAESNKVNIFEILGISSREIRHSKFLSWLLNPAENHYLGDYFLTKFLKNLVIKEDLSSIDLFYIESINLTSTEVKTEYKNIDILLFNEQEKFVCCIENKIYSKEHSNQCERYKKVIYEDFPNFKKLFIYLTIDGSKSSDEEYINYSYEDLYKVLNNVYIKKKDNINTTSKTFIENYLDILNRKMIEDSNIKKICLDIYKKHKKALDLIYEHKPDEKEEFKEIFELVISELDKEGFLIKLETSTKNFLRFHPTQFNKVNHCNYNWKRTKNNFWFEIDPNYGNNLSLVCGNIENVNPTTIDKLNEFKKWDKLSNIEEGRENYSHIKVIKKIFNKNFSELEYEEIKKIIKNKIKEFLQSDKYKKIVSIIENS